MDWVPGILIGVCAVFMLFNWVGLIGAMIGRSKSHSFAPPYLCGVLGAIALLAWPGRSLQWWAIVPLLADPSIGFVCGALAVQSLRKRLR